MQPSPLGNPLQVRSACRKRMGLQRRAVTNERGDGEKMGVIIFCVGLLLGGSFGAIMMGLVIADREEDDADE